MKMKPSATDLRNFREKCDCSIQLAKRVLWRQGIANAIQERQLKPADLPEETCCTIEEILLEILEYIDANK